MARKIASKLIAAAKAKATPKPITPAAAKRLAPFKPFSRPHQSMMKLATGSMPRAARAPRQFGQPRRRSPRR